MLSANDFFCNSVSRWEKYDAKGSTEKGAHKYGQLNEQSWWEKWGENYDGRGYVLKWLVTFLPPALISKATRMLFITFGKCCQICTTKCICTFAMHFGSMSLPT